MTRAPLFATLMASVAFPTALAAQESLYSIDSGLGNGWQYDVSVNPISPVGQTFTIEQASRLDSVSLQFVNEEITWEAKASGAETRIGGSVFDFTISVFAWDAEERSLTGDRLGFGFGTFVDETIVFSRIGAIGGTSVETEIDSAELDPGQYAFVINPALAERSEGDVTPRLGSVSGNVLAVANNTASPYERGDLITQDFGPCVSVISICAFSEGAETRAPLPGPGTWIVNANADLLFSLQFAALAPVGNPLDGLAGALVAPVQIIAADRRTLISSRAGDSIAARGRAVPYTLGTPASTPGEAPELVLSTKSAPGMMGNVYTWVEVTGFHARDDDDDRSFRGAGLQLGADVEIAPNLVAGLSLGTEAIAAAEGSVSQEGDMLFLEPYLGYRNGAWGAEASLLFGKGDFDQSGPLGDGEGETRVRALNLTGSYDIATASGATLTPSLGVTVGTQTVEGTGGVLAGSGEVEVDFSQVSVGARYSRPYGSGAVFAGLYGDYSDSEADVETVNELLVDDGWTGRVEFGGRFQTGRGVGLDTAIEFGGLGGDLRQVSGGLKATFSF